MTEDRDNDRMGRGPDGDSIRSRPMHSSADSDRPSESHEPHEPHELEELVPDPPAVPDGPGEIVEPIEPSEPAEPDGTDVLEEIEPTVVPEPGEATAPGVTPTHPAGQPSATDEATQLRRQVEAKDAQLAKVMTAYRALKKETERLRKRIETHQKRRFEQSKNDFIGHFVEVLDNLDRAIDSIENNFDSDAVLEGIILVRSRLVQLLREEGLEKIFVGGQSFDPTHSEAAGIEPVDDRSQDNIVLRELQRGYMLKGALLRPARVIVGRYSHAAEEATATGDTDPSTSGNPPLAPGEDEGSNN